MKNPPLNGSKRRYFLLLEVLIALGLTMILLSTLMGFYLEISRINSALEKEQDASFRKLYLSSRLAAILPKAISASDKDKDFFFYSGMANDRFSKSGSQTLTFGFDNGIKLDPAFSYHVLGRIYVTEAKQLCLAVWPSPARWNDLTIPPIKQEVLFVGVENLSFEFYVPPYRDRKAILSNNKFKGTYKQNEFLKLDPMGEWKTEWQQEYDELPVLVKIILEMSGPKAEPLTFIYPLPQSRLIIVYE